MFASSSLVQLAYAKETAFGVIPTVGSHNYLRMTGESLDFTISKEASEEINSTRSVSSMIPLTASASGSIETEVSYKEYDVLLQAALQDSFTVYGTNGVGTTFTADFTATTITASVAPTGASAFTTLQKGQFFKVNAPTNPNHGKVLRVSSTVAPTSTVITLSAATPATVSAAVANVSLATSRLTNGTTQESFTIERQATDIGEYWAYTGMTLSSMEVNIASGSRSTMSFSFMGKSAERDTNTQLPGAAVDSNGYDIHSGSTGPVCLIWVDGAPLAGTFVQSLTLSYDNALRSQEAICNLGAIGIGSGTINCTGSMEVYFADGALFNKFVANDNIEFTFSTMDDDGNGYIFTLPKANISAVTTSAGAKDQDMMLSLEFAALRDLANTDPALRQLIFIDRVGVAV